MRTPLRNSIAAIVGLSLLVALASPVVSSEKTKGKDAATVDERYTPAGLRQTFAALCKTLGYRARVVEVDQSEFPYLLYGVIEGHCDYREIREALSSMSGYAYQSCVTAVRRDGSMTVFSLNMIPYQRIGDERADRIMERLKKLAATQQ